MIRWYTRPVDRGQMVEMSYTYDSEGGAYRRTTDRSDGSVSYEYGELNWDREPELTSTDRAPCVDEWAPCSAPE